jgi:hypothetical protein
VRAAGAGWELAGIFSYKAADTGLGLKDILLLPADILLGSGDILLLLKDILLLDSDKVLRLADIQLGLKYIQLAGLERVAAGKCLATSI